MSDASCYQQKAAMMAGKAGSMIDTGENAITGKADEVDPVWSVIHTGQGQKLSDAIGTRPDFRGIEFCKPLRHRDPFILALSPRKGRRNQGSDVSDCARYSVGEQYCR
ncbi:hypothetical protein GCM10007207_15060 [Asaia siamensis]|uniref:Uncharacterized protein n=1 Tax=Asaia siamensis TaxID=110479 RepID=A0ABQ1LVM4_9PROT|nr:hypothetical protein AA0323_0134 [Asaia siamensis NRIC 0323]GGC30524.1 hypothetical protein GCM10007207_15060 [Asaia siamensis]